LERQVGVVIVVADVVRQVTHLGADDLSDDADAASLGGGLEDVADLKVRLIRAALGLEAGGASLVDAPDVHRVV
jgi:hypothetical protein